jgi:cyclopropane fatty-acyl-phospholipid synthase-like methyltransferase
MSQPNDLGWGDFLNGPAPEYDGNGFTANTIAEEDFLFEELALAVGTTVLDIGCGTGRQSIELMRRGCQAPAPDASEYLDSE